MGIVYKALDPDIDREVAIKTIRFDLMSDGTDKEELMKRFIREAQAAGKLTHPNIVTIYDVGREGDLTYIVMQYIEGQSLQKMIASRKEISYGEISDLMSQICEALDFAHARGIVHRDIKPANILMDDAGKPYIVDFGVARVETSTITQAGTTIGTPSYMSPEQVMGKAVDNRSDIFSLGVILYEILTGKGPFEADNITTVIYKIINEEPPLLRETKKDLPADFEHVIQRALAKDPQNRYQNCRQFAQDLRDFKSMTDKTVPLDLKTAGFPELKKKKRARLSYAVRIALIIILAVGTGITYILTRKSGEIPPQKKPDEIVSQVLGAPEAKTDDPLTAVVQKQAQTNLLESRIDLIRQSFENKDYVETVRLSEEILAEDKKNRIAQDYLNQSKMKLDQIFITQTLNSGIESYKRGDYAKSMQEMEKILKRDKDNKEANRYLNMADMALSKREIEKIVERQRKAEENKDLLSLLSDIGPSDLSEIRKEDAVLLFNYYDDIESAISGITTDFSDSRHAKVRFSQIMTALYKKTGQKTVIFEGTKTWQMEKLGNEWKITDIK